MILLNPKHTKSVLGFAGVERAVLVKVNFDDHMVVVGSMHAPHNWCGNSRDDANLCFATWLDSVACCLGRLIRVGKDGSKVVISIGANTRVAMNSGVYV